MTLKHNVIPQHNQSLFSLLTNGMMAHTRTFKDVSAYTRKFTYHIHFQWGVREGIFIQTINLLNITLSSHLAHHICSSHTSTQDDPSKETEKVIGKNLNILNFSVFVSCFKVKVHNYHNEFIKFKIIFNI